MDSSQERSWLHSLPASKIRRTFGQCASSWNPPCSPGKLAPAKWPQSYRTEKWPIFLAKFWPRVGFVHRALGFALHVHATPEKWEPAQQNDVFEPSWPASSKRSFGAKSHDDGLIGKYSINYPNGPPGLQGISRAPKGIIREAKGFLKHIID